MEIGNGQSFHGARRQRVNAALNAYLHGLGKQLVPTYRHEVTIDVVHNWFLYVMTRKGYIEDLPVPDAASTASTSHPIDDHNVGGTQEDSGCSTNAWQLALQLALQLGREDWANLEGTGVSNNSPSSAENTVSAEEYRMLLSVFQDIVNDLDAREQSNVEHTVCSIERPDAIQPSTSPSAGESETQGSSDDHQRNMVQIEQPDLAPPQRSPSDAESEPEPDSDYWMRNIVQIERPDLLPPQWQPDIEEDVTNHDSDR